MNITPKDKQEKFEDFIKWSRILIQDFNIIDKEIKDPSQVFDYLKAVKEMDHWSLDLNPTELIKRQWGANLSKFNGVAMLGGVTMNGGEIYQQAQEQLERLEEQIQLSFETPIDYMVG